MKYIILVFLISHSYLSIADCDFSGTVHPQDKQTEVEESYRYTCEWFSDTFNVFYDPSIILENVFYADSWDDFDLSEEEKEDLKESWGRLINPLRNGVSNIYLINSTEDSPFENNDFVAKTMLFHELIHFFIKKSSFEAVSEASFNRGMHETIAYWSQNQYVKMITGNTLIDYLKNNEEQCKISETFVKTASTIYGINFNKFICQAIHFLDENRLEKFNNIINGRYQDIVLTGGFVGRNIDIKKQ